MMVSTSLNECRRCGTCCLKGGPALHTEDLRLLQEHILRFENLVTIRKGEPLLFLSAENPQPAPADIIKIKGKGSEWSCMFFERRKAACRIYDQRPLECNLMQCWDTAALEKVAGINLLKRTDIIDSHDPVMPFIEEQKNKCPLNKLEQFLKGASQPQKGDDADIMTQLTNLMNTDLSVRLRAQEQLHISLDLELFYFGRPLFVILKQLGMKIFERRGILLVLQTDVS